MPDTSFQTGGFMAPTYPPVTLPTFRGGSISGTSGGGSFGNTTLLGGGSVGGGVGPAVGLADYPSVYNMLNSLQQGANMGRIPNEPALENQSSADIAGLLNPGTSFPDVNRQSAELAAGRGVPGSAAAYGTGLRMTDEERLRRIALGENLLSGATARNPSAPLPNVRDFILTPYEQAKLMLEQQRGAGGGGGRGGGPAITYGGGLPSYPSPGTSSVSGGGYPAPVAYPGTGPQTEIQDTRGVYPNPLAPMLPLYPGEGSSFDFGNPPAPNYEGGTYASPVPYNPAIDTYNYGGDAEAGGGMGAYEGAGGLDNLINDYLNSGGYE